MKELEKLLRECQGSLIEESSLIAEIDKLLADPPRCRNCKFFERSMNDRLEDWCSSGHFLDNDNTFRDVLPDDVQYGAWKAGMANNIFHNGPDFGCIHHERKEPPWPSVARTAASD